RTVRAAARKAGIGERTLGRWLRCKPAFRRRVAELRDRIVHTAVGQLSNTMSAAVSKLKKVLNSKNEAIGFKAPRSILELTLRLRENTELAERLAEIESQLARDRHRSHRSLS